MSFFFNIYLFEIFIYIHEYPLVKNSRNIGYIFHSSELRTLSATYIIREFWFWKNMQMLFLIIAPETALRNTNEKKEQKAKMHLPWNS